MAYVGSERTGEQVLQIVTSFLRRRFKFKDNEAKSTVARVQHRKFLGFSFSAGREAKRHIPLRPCCVASAESGD